MAAFKTEIPTREIRMAALVLIIYAVGFAGIIIPYSNRLFLRLIPVVLILSLLVSLLYHREYNFKTYAIFTLIVLTSWIIEAAGVATGFIFGNYSYGPALGIRVYDTPLIIGFTWLLLVYGSACLTDNLDFHPFLKILSASALMVLYDLALEVAAPALGMWEFNGGVASLRNYVAWFLIAILFHSLVKITGISTSNRVAAVVFVVQFIFFLALALIFHL